MDAKTTARTPTHTSAPATPSSQPVAKTDARAPSPQTPPIGRRVATLEQATRVDRPHDHKPQRDYSKEDQKAFEEIVAGPFEQKPDRPDGSHTCSVNGCTKWAGFTHSLDPKKVAAVVLASGTIPYFICRDHYRGAVWSFRRLPELFANRRDAYRTGDKTAIATAEKEYTEFPRISVYVSLDRARADIERAVETARIQHEPRQQPTPAPKPRQPKPVSAAWPPSGRMDSKEARRAARTFLRETLEPHMAGFTTEQLRITLNGNAEPSNVRWDEFEKMAREILTGKTLDFDVASEAFTALLLLANHRKTVLGV